MGGEKGLKREGENFCVPCARRLCILGSVRGGVWPEALSSFGNLFVVIVYPF